MPRHFRLNLPKPHQIHELPTAPGLGKSAGWAPYASDPAKVKNTKNKTDPRLTIIAPSGSRFRAAWRCENQVCITFGRNTDHGKNPSKNDGNKVIDRLTAHVCATLSRSAADVRETDSSREKLDRAG